MNWIHIRIVVGLFALLIVTAANGAYIFLIDLDGQDDGVLTYNSNFSFGGDTTAASQSIASSAFGMSGDSIYGGDGSAQPDTYVYTYTPGIDGDNLALTPGQNLGSGNFASGAVAGGLGLYNVYATWPYTENVSGGNTQYQIETAGALPVITSLDQNYQGHTWVLLGQILYSSGDITVTQIPTGQNTFVSMRAAGLLFEPAESPVPEPSTVLLLGTGLLGILLFRRRTDRSRPGTPAGK